MNEIAELLKMAMVKQNIRSACELARRSGVSHDIVGRLLKGEESAKMINVIKCADVLGLKIKFVSKD